MRLPKFVIDWLLSVHESAKATPYFHLEGYMLRDWILGYRSPDRNAARPQDDPWHGNSGGLLYCLLTKLLCIRAHTILRSDNDRHRHDHPCASLSVVLDNGYWEVCEPTEYADDHPSQYEAALQVIEAGWPNPGQTWPEIYGIYWRGPGSVIARSAKAAHRLILPKGKATKSIFAMGPKTNSWGFYTSTGKIGWREYLGVDQ